MDSFVWGNVSFPIHQLLFDCLRLKDFKLKDNLLAVIHDSNVEVWDILRGQILHTLSG